MTPLQQVLANSAALVEIDVVAEKPGVERRFKSDRTRARIAMRAGVSTDMD